MRPADAYEDEDEWQAGRGGASESLVGPGFSEASRHCSGDCGGGQMISLSLEESGCCDFGGEVVTGRWGPCGIFANAVAQ